jgi:hypothetical protein
VLIDSAGGEAVDDREGLVVRSALMVEDCEIVKTVDRRGQGVDLVAGLFTLPASDAAGEVHQASVGVRRGARLPCLGRSWRRSRQTDDAAGYEELPS